MNIIKRLILVCILIGSLCNLQASLGLERAIDRLYHFDFNNFNTINETLCSKDQNISNTYYFWTQLLILEDKGNVHSQIRDIYDLVGSYDEIDSSEFLLVALFKLRSELYLNNRLEALRVMSRIIPLVKALKEQPNYSEEAKLIVGLYLTTIGHFDNEGGYYLIRKLLPEGNFDQGMSLLKECSSSENAIISTEAKYFLAKIHKDLLHNKREAQVYLNELCNTYPENVIFQMDLLRTLGVDECENKVNYIVNLIDKNNTINRKQKDYLHHHVNLISTSLLSDKHTLIN